MNWLIQLWANWVLWCDFKRWKTRRIKDQQLFDHIRRQRLDEGDRD